MKYRFPVFYSHLFAGHNTGVGHPENAGRLTAVVDYLETCQTLASDSNLKNDAHADSHAYDWAEKISWIEPSNRDVLEAVYLVHDAAYVRALKALASQGGGYLDSDTVLSAQSYDLALLAVAAWLDGIDWVWQHKTAGFVLARPPGHHAERDRGMGFCLLSNAAIAAHYARATLNINRVAILDWDVHHGNGTQALVSANPNIAYCSFHQSPAYPGTGQQRETGEHHNVLNLPLPPGADIRNYQSLWAEQAQPFFANFGADLMIVSAGYDANQADPLAGLSLQPEDYGWFTEVCMQFNVPILFGLEGGYDYDSLARSVAATIRCAVSHRLS
ncbi:MAG: histone deacetylase [Phormidesmis sp. RL_2_1]|nr:histone deacetylase [Phormidesmis sp. RL_2_1]